VLCILDGLGERAERADNAVLLANAPNLARLRQGPRTVISTSGPDVGLPKGQMGNSEVGHLNFGAGRIALMDISRIDNAVADGELGATPVIRDIFNVAKHKKSRLHLFGLLSDGGVHSTMTHLFALIEAAYQQEIPVVVHAFLDGRDTPPRSAAGYLQQLEAVLDDGKKGVIGTISGRFYAMDRDKRWERVIRAYHAIVRGEAQHADTAAECIQAAYAKDITDEFVEPTRIGDYTGIKGDFMCDFTEPNPV
jgi:2,3-bisphosphoglycerate-independent phosphoglycerate mutase